MQTSDQVSVIPPDAGSRSRIGDGAVETIFKITGEQTGGAVAVAEHVLQPKQLGAPFHTHRREHEISYVLEGTITVQIGEEIFDAGPGTTLFKPRGIPHAFWNSRDEGARFVEVFVPAGFEHYFEELSSASSISNLIQRALPKGPSYAILLASSLRPSEVKPISSLTFSRARPSV